MEQKIELKEISLKYTKFGCNVSPDLEREDYIYIWVSDWNKDHFGFYASIDPDTYEDDIEEIQQLIDSFNYGGDIYFELINHSDNMEYFYKWVNSLNGYTNSDIMNTDIWAVFEERGDIHFMVLHECLGANIDYLDNENYVIYEDWDDKFENENPDLYEQLQKHNAYSCFDIEHYYYGTGTTELSDGSIVETF